MQKGDNYRLVIDTNLIISALIVSDSIPGRLLQAWQEDKFTLVTSQILLDEIKEVLNRAYLKNRYHLESEKIDYLFHMLSLGAEIVTPLSPKELSIHCRDLKDDILLATDLGGEANYLITGDKDLLILDRDSTLEDLRILTVKDFLSFL